MLQWASLIDLTVILIGITLICRYWEPPLQKSLQAVVVLVLGCLIGMLLDKGVTTGLLAATIAFWQGELITNIKNIKAESGDLICFDASEKGEKE